MKSSGCSKPNDQKGFSLAELLITLALLALLAAFAIPKVLISTQEGQRRSSLKQAISTLEQVLFEGSLTHRIQPANMSQYFMEKLNFQKTATPGGGGCVAEGVMTANPSSPYTYWDNDWVSSVGLGGGVLPNGTAICGFINYACPLCCAENVASPLPAGQSANGLMIDWNGSGGPNVVGQDRLWVVLSYGRSDVIGIACSPTPIPPGSLVVGDGSLTPASNPSQQISAVNVALYNNIMNK